MIRTGGSCIESGVVIARTASFCLAFSRGSNCSSHCLYKRRQQSLKTEAVTIHCQSEMKWAKISKTLKKLKSLYDTVLLAFWRTLKQINKSSKTITCFKSQKNCICNKSVGLDFVVVFFFFFQKESNYLSITLSHLTIVNLHSTHFLKSICCTIIW